MLFDILFFAISFLIVGVSYYLFFHKSSTPKSDTQQQQQQQQANNTQQRNQQNVQRRDQRVNLNEENSDDQEDNDDEEDEEEEKKLDANTKEAKKQAKKQEKRQQREAFQNYIENKERSQQQKRSKYEERDRQRELEEQKREEEQKRQEELQRLKEQEEFERWQQFMQVEESGNDKMDQKAEEEYYRQLNEKINQYIKLRKVVVLEEIAGEFKMTTSDIINRIKSLEINQEINGVIDERGKYIYVTNKEFESVKNYILQKGRVFRSELLQECNKLIKLDPSKQDKEKIQQEEKQLLQEVNQEFQQLQSDQKQ